MKKTNKFLKTTAFLICIILFVTSCCIGGFAYDRISDCGEDCEFYPAIIVPGLGQSSVCVADENGDFVLNGDGEKISAFPAYVQTGKLIKRLLFPLLGSLFAQRDVGLSQAVSDAIEICFGINGTGNDAQPTGNTITEKMPYPLSECSEYEKEVINSHIPFNLYPTELPEDHIYYFSYNSFGNHVDMVAELKAYIEMVKEQTGHDKVTIVPISQGGSIFSALIEYYPEVAGSLHKVMFVVPALDGSKIIGDIFNDRVAFLDKEYLYNGFLTEMGLLDSETARMIEVVFRLFPDNVLMNVVGSAVETLVGSVMTRCTSMWALCPSADYESAAEKYLSDPELAEIRRQTDKYYEAQCNSRANVQKLLDKGVQVFCVAEYNTNLINVGESWNGQNADYIIQLDSTSLGAYSAKVGETLGEDYVQKNTYCNNPEHNHISPDKVVDASAGLLPDTTFYFDGQRHDLTQHNDVILKLAMELIANDDIKDVYSSPDFPQFNDGRDVRNLRTYIASAETALGENEYSAEIKDSLIAAKDNGQAVLDNNISSAEDYQNAEAKLKAALIAAGIMKDETKVSTGVFERMSLSLYERYGTKGFSQIPGVYIENALNGIGSAVEDADC